MVPRKKIISISEERPLVPDDQDLAFLYYALYERRATTEKEAFLSARRTVSLQPNQVLITQQFMAEHYQMKDAEMWKNLLKLKLEGFVDILKTEEDYIVTVHT